MTRAYRILLLGLVFTLPSPAIRPETSCSTCHADKDLFDPEMTQIVAGFEEDVHAKLGLSCHDCHGGNPEMGVADDYGAAMDEGYEPNPYRGIPTPAEIPGFCGRCHSDPTFMKRFKPDARVDQEREYWTSQHGRALAGGDTNVATCVDCHGTHGIRAKDDTGSRVYPTQVAETCRSCHGDVAKMEGYTLADGTPLPIDQFARWRQSVHAAALLDKEDLSAPTCNDCHGNHGATPPGLDAVGFVCGQCHGREAEIFRLSPKHDAFEAHNEYLAEAGSEGCAGCHQAPEPAAELSGIHAFSECASCHGNHGIVRPNISMLSPPPPSVCEICHGYLESLGEEVEEPERIRRSHEAVREVVMTEAAALGLEGEELFNWLVDKALTLPNHTAMEQGDEARIRLRPEFERLFTKFRIGKTVYTYEDPATGELVEGRVTRCDTCHAAEPLMADEPVGLETASELLSHMQELTALTARADRILLRARRGGVETRGTLLEIDQAVDAQIGLQVLVHSFVVDEESEFMEVQAEGVQHAQTAVESGREALEQLAFRRRGLAVALIIILVVLIALALKIRDISARRDEHPTTG